MGAMKHWMAQQDAKKAVADEIAIRVGLLKRCEMCEDVTDPLNNNFEDAYKLANYLVSKGDELVAIFDGNRRELTDLIQGCVHDHGEECYCDYRASKND